jgi:hypothetical protein
LEPVASHLKELDKAILEISMGDSLRRRHMGLSHARGWKHVAKRHNAVFEGYVEVFKKTREFSELSDDLVARLQSFLRFRNMLVDLPSVSSFFHLLSGR